MLITEEQPLDAAGRPRSPATMPGYHAGRPTRNTTGPTSLRRGTTAADPGLPAELTGVVVQAQQTVDLAVQAIGTQLRDKNEEGAETGESVHVVRLRSFVVAGRLDQLRGASGVHTEKYRSFELYRRSLYEPEIVTFDELLARAAWHVSLAEADPAASV